MEALEEAQQQFAKWRASKRYVSEKIPDELWSCACALSDTYPIPQIAQVLGVASSQIRERLQRYDRDRRSIAVEQNTPINTSRKPTITIAPFYPETKPQQQKASTAITGDEVPIEIALPSGMIIRLPISSFRELLKTVLSAALEV